MFFGQTSFDFLNHKDHKGRCPSFFCLAFALLCELCGLCGEKALCQEIAVPVEAQCALLSKVLTYDRNHAARAQDSMVIAVIYQTKFRASLAVKDEFVKAMAESSPTGTKGVFLRHVLVDISDEIDLTAVIAQSKADIIYVTPLRATAVAAITVASRANHALTLTGVLEYVEAGLAVGIGTKGGKPQIVINLPAARAEGADFSSQLLKLAKVIE